MAADRWPAADEVLALARSGGPSTVLTPGKVPLPSPRRRDPAGKPWSPLLDPSDSGPRPLCLSEGESVPTGSSWRFHASCEAVTEAPVLLLTTP